jgi:hypothetical protein
VAGKINLIPSKVCSQKKAISIENGLKKKAVAKITDEVILWVA